MFKHVSLWVIKNRVIFQLKTVVFLWAKCRASLNSRKYVFYKKKCT